MQESIRYKYIRVAGPIMGLLLLFTSLVSCGGEESAIRERSPLEEQLQSQIQGSCEGEMVRFDKEISNLNANPVSKEDSTWLSLPMIRVGETESGTDSMQCMLISELEWASKSFHDAPSMQAYYDTKLKEDSVLIQIKASSANQSDLKSQKYILDEASGTILYWQSTYKKDNWLYSLDVEVEIFFDEKGRYLQHNLKVRNDVSLMSSGFNAWISGKARYDE
ncbi:MAG: hypothetical protein AAFN10_16730 [Bacteroidota bacterium]